MNVKVYLSGLMLVLFSCFYFVKPAQAQNKVTIQGVVKTPDGARLPGASVKVKNAQQGAVTDVNGAFTLNVNPGQVLEISCAEPARPAGCPNAHRAARWPMPNRAWQSWSATHAPARHGSRGGPAGRVTR